MEARFDTDAQIVRYTELLEAKDKSNHLVADSLRQFPRTQHNITHTQQHTEKEDIIERHRENKGREKKESTCFDFFFACDGGGAVDFPQRVIFLLLDAVSSTCAQVDVTQPVEKCSKLPRESIKWTRCGRSTAFSVIQRLLFSSITIHVGRNWMRLT